MPLSGHLAKVVLGRACPHCGHVLHKNGSWFQHIALYKCESCQKQVDMTYEAKVELFQKHSASNDRPNEMGKIQRWRNRAEECRVDAEGMRDPDAQRTLFEIARVYERLAERTEARPRPAGRARNIN